MAQPHLHGLLAFGGVALFAAAASAMPAGCTVLTNDALPDDAGPESGVDGSAPSCGLCLEVECSGPWSVCLLDGTCQAMHACATAPGCGDTCKSSCVCEGPPDGGAPDGGPAALRAYLAFSTCNDARACGPCASQCPGACADSGAGVICRPLDAGADASTDSGDAGAGTDAGDAGTGIDASAEASTDGGASVDGCASCVANACGTALAGCRAGTECAAFLTCAYACATTACTDECGRRFQAGKQGAADLSSCTLASCLGACGL